MTDKLKSGTKAWFARQDRWRHNSFFGHAKMMQSNCRAIMESKTATSEAKAIANRINTLALELADALQTRRTT